MPLKTKNPKFSKKIVLGIIITLLAIVMSGCSTPTDSAPTGTEPSTTTGTDPSTPTGTDPSTPTETDPSKSSISADKIVATIKSLPAGGPYTITATGTITDTIIDEIRAILWKYETKK